MDIHKLSDLKEKYLENSFEKYSFEKNFGFDIKPYTSVVHFEPDDIILQEGDAPKRLYYMFNGRAKLYMTQRNGSITVINFLQSPCFIGEMEMFDKNRQTHGVVALSTCECFCIDLAECRDKLMSDVIFLQHMCRSLSNKALEDVSVFSKNQAYPLKVKLAAFILMTENNGLYRERHTEASGYLGVTYRHLLYVLAEFVKDGILEKGAAGYRILDRRRLEELADR